ncbi:hypothetical protein NQ315_016771 [Exocentrus adspersus]|uniref:Uncharacterized protein n=1 Tax=Exocentrus adspersus TaxID=1586481 RepID=A0AAV8V6Y9_9CUCU|nr:hypothetical protein NQ315_016771 [Exocentrus adspersus]
MHPRDAIMQKKLKFCSLDKNDQLRLKETHKVRDNCILQDEPIAISFYDHRRYASTKVATHEIPLNAK